VLSMVSSRHIPTGLLSLSLPFRTGVFSRIDSCDSSDFVLFLVWPYVCEQTKPFYFLLYSIARICLGFLAMIDLCLPSSQIRSCLLSPFSMNLGPLLIPSSVAFFSDISLIP